MEGGREGEREMMISICLFVNVCFLDNFISG